MSPLCESRGGGVKGECWQDLKRPFKRWFHIMLQCFPNRVLEQSLEQVISQLGKMQELAFLLFALNHFNST